LAVKAITSFIKNHEKEMNVIMSFRDCLPLILKVNIKIFLKQNANPRYQAMFCFDLKEYTRQR
jgi:hypothetical protein